MKQKQLMAAVSLGTLAIGTAVYLVAKKKRQQVSTEDSMPKRKHSHIRKASHGHEPDFTA